MIDKDRIQQQLNNTLTETNFPELGKKYNGKVRDTYLSEDGERLTLITTDRQSAFDRILAAIPFKGQVLNQVTKFWFENTADIVPNHMIEMPDPNVMVAKPCSPFPVEFVMRGYITGVTGTAVWTNYNNGEREFCGVTLPEGLSKNQAFAEPIITPTTKGEEHDEKISPAEIVEQGLMTQEDWDACAEISKQLFARGQEIAAKNGMILVDTKYEMGKDVDGNIVLIDEIHTPDSSRYWIADTYAERIAAGQEPDNIDKEFLRLWFVDNCDPYNDETLPEAPEELVVELSARYIQLYEAITGESFEYPIPEQSVAARIASNLAN